MKIQNLSNPQQNFGMNRIKVSHLLYDISPETLEAAKSAKKKLLLIGGGDNIIKILPEALNSKCGSCTGCSIGQLLGNNPATAKIIILARKKAQTFGESMKVLFDLIPYLKGHVKGRKEADIVTAAENLIQRLDD